MSVLLFIGKIKLYYILGGCQMAEKGLENLDSLKVTAKEFSSKLNNKPSKNTGKDSV